MSRIIQTTTTRVCDVCGTEMPIMGRLVSTRYSDKGIALEATADVCGACWPSVTNKVGVDEKTLYIRVNQSDFFQVFPGVKPKTTGDREA